MTAIKDVPGVLRILDDAFTKLGKDLWDKALSEGSTDLELADRIIQYKNDYFNIMQGDLHTYSIFEELENKKED